MATFKRMPKSLSIFVLSLGLVLAVTTFSEVAQSSESASSSRGGGRGTASQMPFTPPTFYSEEAVTQGPGSTVQRKTQSVYREREQGIVIPESPLDASAMASLSEDIRVMAHILDECLKRSTFRPSHIGGVLTDFGGFFQRSKRTESMYVEGYGAIFLMTVDFPLVTQPGRPNQTEDVNTPPHDSTWERARQNVLASGRSGGSSQVDPTDDVDRVEEMKRELVRSLRYAARMRHLQAEDRIVIRVSRVTAYGYQEQTMSHSSFGRRGGMRGGFAMGGGGGYGGGASATSTVLILQTRKSDVDAFAQGEIGFSTFYQRVQVQNY